MKRFSLRDVLFTVTILALLLALILTRRQLNDVTRQLTSFRDEMRYLTIDDTDDIHAINIPAFGNKQWRWRIGLPDEKRYQLRIAYDDIPAEGMAPTKPQRVFAGELPAEAFVFTASVAKAEDGWQMSWTTECENDAASEISGFSFSIDATNTDWLNKNGGCSIDIAGRQSTEVGNGNEPFYLLRFRNGIEPAPGVVATNPNPTDGILIWIEPIKKN